MASAVNHKPDTAAAAASMICRYYSRGMCRFGDLCRFVHMETTTSTPQPTADRRTNPTHRNTTENPLVNANIKATDPNSWVMAPVFVPKMQNSRTRAAAAGAPPDNNIPTSSSGNSSCEQAGSSSNKISRKSHGEDDNDDNMSYASVLMGPGAAGGDTGASAAAVTLCPYQLNCAYGELCMYEHNKLCDMCGRYCLHPTDKEQRKRHIAACIQQHEKDMELSFAVARSEGKTCGICFDVIMEKSGREQRFGILPNCSHIFCLECIRKWRQAKQFDNKIIRACPECRIPSDYVCPSAFWVETKDEKDKLIGDYKNALGDKDCKYFKKGEGKCPFGNKCFYKHALPDGERVDVGVPRRNKRKIQRAEDEILDLFDLYLWDFVDDRREFHWLEILSNLSDSGDSDWSDEFD